MLSIFHTIIRKVPSVFLAILFIVSILFAVTLLYREKSQSYYKDIKQSLGINQSDKDEELISLDSPNDLKKRNQNDLISIGANDMEMQRFIDNLSNYEASEIMDPSVTDSINEKMQKDLELIRSGNHPDYPMPPIRENFSTDMDYYKADLEYYKKKSLESEGTKYQKTFDFIVRRIEKNILREQNREFDELESLKIEKLRQERENYMIQEGSWIAGLMALSEEDRKIYLKYIDPNIQDDGSLILPDEAVDALIKENVSKSSVSSDIHKDKIKHVDNVNLLIEDDLHSDLIKDFPDVFSHTDTKSRDAFLQRLTTEDARQFFNDRQSLLQKEYATIIKNRLKGLSKHEQDKLIQDARKSLSNKWDSDFTNSVINQLKLDDK